MDQNMLDQLESQCSSLNHDVASLTLKKAALTTCEKTASAQVLLLSSRLAKEEGAIRREESRLQAAKALRSTLEAHYGLIQPLARITASELQVMKLAANAAAKAAGGWSPNASEGASGSVVLVSRALEKASKALEASSIYPQYQQEMEDLAKTAKDLEAETQTIVQEYHGVRSLTAQCVLQQSAAEKLAAEKEQANTKQKASLDDYASKIPLLEARCEAAEVAFAERQQLNSEGWKKVNEINTRTAEIGAKTGEILELTRQSERIAAANKTVAASSGAAGPAAPNARPAGPSGPRPPPASASGPSRHPHAAGGTPYAPAPHPTGSRLPVHNGGYGGNAGGGQGGPGRV